MNNPTKSQLENTGAKKVCLEHYFSNEHQYDDSWIVRCMTCGFVNGYESPRTKPVEDEVKEECTHDKDLACKKCCPNWLGKPQDPSKYLTEKELANLRQGDPECTNELGHFWNNGTGSCIQCGKPFIYNQRFCGCRNDTLDPSLEPDPEVPNQDPEFCDECGAPEELGHEPTCSKEPKLPEPIKIKNGETIEVPSDRAKNIEEVEPEKTPPEERMCFECYKTFKSNEAGTGCIYLCKDCFQEQTKPASPKEVPSEETFDHMLTVIASMFVDEEAAMLEGNHDKEDKLRKEAFEYARSWLKEHDTSEKLPKPASPKSKQIDPKVSSESVSLREKIHEIVYLAISKMLDNPDSVGIYPTTNCYNTITDKVLDLITKCECQCHLVRWYDEHCDDCNPIREK